MDSNKNFRKLVRRKRYIDTNFDEENLVQEPKLQRISKEFGTQNNQQKVNNDILIFVLVTVIVVCFFSITNSINKTPRRSSIPSNYSSSNYTSNSSSTYTSSSTYNSTSNNVTNLSADYIEVTLNTDVLEQLGYTQNRDGESHTDNVWCDLTKNGERITSFDIPATYEYNGNKYKITAIGRNCFEDSTLQSVTIPDTVTEIEEYAFLMSRISSINIPNSVTKIGVAAFSGCGQLKSIVIPESVKDAEGAFIPGMGDCVSVVYYMGEEPTNWGTGPTYKKYSSENETKAVEEQTTSNQNITYTNIVLDKKVLYQLGYNPADKKNFTSVKIPYTYEFKGKHYKITKVGEKAFYNYGALQKVTIEEGVQILGVSAFENCTALTTVNLPKSINKINNNAFANCKALTTINLPDGLTELRDSLFFNCLSLSNIDIPSSVTSIGDMVFYKCKSLEKITIPENVTSIGQSAFAGCKGLHNLDIPSNVKTIKQWAFSNCVSLNRVDIPDTVTSIGDDAFSNIGYVYYDGNATGQPWGALDSNKVPEIPYTLEDMWEKSLNNVNIREFFGEPTRFEKFFLKFKGADRTYYIPARWYGDSLMICLSNDCGSPSIVSVLCCARNGLKTNNGIQVGDTESKLLESYHNRLTKTKNGYYFVLPCDAEYTYSIYYHIKDGRVRKMYIGRYFEPSESSLYSKLYEEVAKAEDF